MTYQAKHPAAFINVIAEDGTKAEAIDWLQRTWDELQDLRIALQTIEWTEDARPLTTLDLPPLEEHLAKIDRVAAQLRVAQGESGE